MPVAGVGLVLLPRCRSRALGGPRRGEVAGHAAVERRGGGRCRYSGPANRCPRAATRASLPAASECPGAESQRQVFDPQLGHAAPVRCCRPYAALAWRQGTHRQPREYEARVPCSGAVCGSALGRPMRFAGRPRRRRSRCRHVYPAQVPSGWCFVAYAWHAAFTGHDAHKAAATGCGCPCSETNMIRSRSRRASRDEPGGRTQAPSAGRPSAGSDFGKSTARVMPAASTGR